MCAVVSPLDQTAFFDAKAAVAMGMQDIAT
jgi:hypothetical protein